MNRLADSHYVRFEEELAHPKLDALVESMADAWTTGKKSLVFVRRVASVDEIKRKLDERYNDWILQRLQSELPAPKWSELGSVVRDFKRERGTGRRTQASNDDGTADTFFGWFFRGEPAPSVLSGAALSRRLQRSAFFGQPLAAYLLDCDTSAVWAAMLGATGLDAPSLRERLDLLARAYLTKKSTAGVTYDAVQQAAVDLLAERGHARAADLMHQFSERPPALPTATSTCEPNSSAKPSSPG